VKTFQFKIDGILPDQEDEKVNVIAEDFIRAVDDFRTKNPARVKKIKSCVEIPHVKTIIVP